MITRVYGEDQPKPYPDSNAYRNAPLKPLLNPKPNSNPRCTVLHDLLSYPNSADLGLSPLPLAVVTYL